MSILPVSSEDEIITANLLGPFRYLVKFTLLDTSYKTKCIRGFACIIALILVVLMFARVGELMQTDGNSLSFAWAESNFFGFVGIHAAVCSICIFGWTYNGFIQKYAKKLAKVRMLRADRTSGKMDDYRLVQVLALLFSVPWLFAYMAWIVYNLLQKKILYGGHETNMIFCVLITISNFYIWLISTVVLAFYTLVFSSLNREVANFNEDLQKAKEEKSLKLLGILEKFDFRQNQIMELILNANESLQSFAGFAPLFLFYGLVNGVYLTGFISSVPLLYFIFCCIFLAAIIIYNLLTLSPACALQQHLANTSKILINNDEFECSKDPIVYQTYRVMVDRLQKLDTRLYVISAIPITTRTLAIAAFITPNLGMLLLMFKKVLIANGGHV